MFQNFLKRNSKKLMKILVVDDNSEICEMIETILASEGYDSVSCPNPLIAGAMIKKVRPKILITDILMSGLDGRNLVKELRATKEGKNLKIIMISANLEFNKPGILEGADAFLAKPFQMEDLLDKVKALIHS